MDWAWVAGVAALITAIGAAIVAFRKAGPESSQILVDAASDVVVIQREWIAKAEQRALDAETKLADFQRQLNEMKTLESEVARMREELSKRDSRIAALEKENRKLRERVLHLENGST